MSSLAIRIENLSKRYFIGAAQQRATTFYDAVTSTVSAPWRRFRMLSQKSAELEEFWALRELEFDVNDGDVIGIIGRNGAGKSTLLKILSRIVEPTTGRVEIHGRVASLLEVGTGFHPELTGRENIYLNGSILGMSNKEIDAKYDAIVDFSGVEKFLETPFKRYSSGMGVRLAFAVAAHLDPEILVIDEVLAVGDADFQKKCLGKMSEVAGDGRTVLFVSHNMTAVRRLTQRVVWLEKGRVRRIGESSDVVEEYLSETITKANSITLPPQPEKAMSLRSVQVGDPAASVFEYSTTIPVTVEYDVNQDIEDVHVACLVNYGDTCVFTTGDADVDTSNLKRRQIGRYRGQFDIPGKLLNEGRYSITVSIGEPMVRIIDRHADVITFEIVDNESQRHQYSHRKTPGIIALDLPWDTDRLHD